MIKLIYIGLIIIITIWTFYLYIDRDQDYRNEIRRINSIESKRRKRRDIINHHRLNSNPCTSPNLNTPRDCYMGSNYNCRWGELADRCNLIE
jgi:hypothetical protein